MQQELKDTALDTTRKFDATKKKHRQIDLQIADLNDKIENMPAGGGGGPAKDAGDSGPGPDLTIFENMIKELKKQLLSLRRTVQDKLDSQDFYI